MSNQNNDPNEMWAVYVTLCNEEKICFKILGKNLSKFQQRAWRFGVQKKMDEGRSIEFVNPLFIKTIIATKQ